MRRIIGLSKLKSTRFKPETATIKLKYKGKDGSRNYAAGYVWPAHYKSKEDPYGNKKRNWGAELLKETVYLGDHEIVLYPKKTYTLLIDYPLTRPYKQNIVTGSKGINLQDLIDIIVKAYKKIYKEENKTTKLKEETIQERTKNKSMLINRAHTDGKYGIWGHDLGDLTITNISIGKDNIIRLGVDS